MLGGKNHEVSLGSGDKITFVKAKEFIMTDQKINATARDLTREEAEVLRTELADVVEKLIQNGEPDFSDLEK